MFCICQDYRASSRGLIVYSKADVHCEDFTQHMIDISPHDELSLLQGYPVPHLHSTTLTPLPALSNIAFILHTALNRRSIYLIPHSVAELQYTNTRNSHSNKVYH